MKRFVFLLIITFIGLNCASAQKIRNASGTAQFRLEEDMSKDELKDKLRHHAIVNAIEREYGTYVTQESFVDIDDGSTEFRIFGKTMVRGEWLKTTSEDFKEEMRKTKEGRRNRHELWMSLKIEGKVRELSQPEIEFDFFTTNCQKAACKTGVFESGDPMYFHFNSPVSGFLSIYAIEEDQALRLLPYQNMPLVFKNAVPIEADQEYVFFSPYGDQDYFEGYSRHLVDELIMLTDKEEEFLNLYLVFSTEEFIKPSLQQAQPDHDTGLQLPKSVNAATLVDWLESNRINNVNFHYRQLKLKIIS